MQFFKPTPLTDYIPARLSKGQEWYVYFYVKNPQTGQLKRFRHKLNRFKNKRERERFARQLMESINQKLALGWNPVLEESAPKAGTNFYEAIDNFLRIKGRTAEGSSMRSYRSYIKTIKSWMESKGVAPESFLVMSFNRNTALSLMREIEENDSISAQTYNNYLGFCMLLFNWFKEKGYVYENPFEGMKKKPRRQLKKIRRMLSDEEMATLREFLAANHPNYLSLCLMCYCCFIRPKEIALLKCGDIDLERQTIRISAEIAKNDNESYRTIPDEMMPYIKALDLSDPKNYVFSDHHTFTPGRKKILEQRIAQFWGDVVRPACGFPMEIKFYSLKDTGITNMIGSGVPVSFVKQQADHSSLAMTSIYLGNNAKRAAEEIREVNLLK